MRYRVCSTLAALFVPVVVEVCAAVEIAGDVAETIRPRGIGAVQVSVTRSKAANVVPAHPLWQLAIAEEFRLS